MAKYPGMKIVLSETAEFATLKGKNVMRTFLDSGKKIDAVYAHNDDMALGAIQAIQEKGLQPGKDIVLISIDAVRGAFEAMKEGKLNATVECSPQLGPLTFDMVEKVLAGQKVPHYLQVKDRLFEPADAESVLSNWPRPAVAVEAEGK
jgi:simple sugar transport system substrate-binding protein